MTTTELQRQVIQVIEPDEHNDYALAEPFRVLADGKHIVALEELPGEKDSYMTRLLSLAGFREATPPPTVLLEDGTDAGADVQEGDILRVRGEETHLGNIFEGEKAQVTARGTSSESGECDWCETDYSRYGRLLGSLFATLHAIRRHPGELETWSER